MIDTNLILLALVLIAGFYMAWNIGANDVANAMGTSVGSGALTLKQALVIAAVLEFCGAYFFGSHVSETIQKGLIDNDVFIHTPYTLVYGMLAALIGVGIWLQIASFFGWPVSTTHAIVGAVIGFGTIVGGIESIYWDNVFYIVTSWVLSPLLGGILSYFLFVAIRKYIFYNHHPLEAAKRAMPFIVFIFTTVLFFLLLFNGLSNVELNLSIAQALGMSFALSGIASLITYYLVQGIKSQPHSKEDLEIAHAEFNAIEKMFGYLQILSAALMAFSHGANDVANAIGPLAAAVNILQTGAITDQTDVPAWALLLGGVGIVIGLATWGWRVIETVGRKITELTPTRGFTAEFGAATTILLATRLGLPISTTHTLVGAVIGIGLARGMGALNLGMTRDIFASWLITIPAGAGLSVVIFYVIKMIFGV